MYFGIGLFINAALMLQFSDQIESALGLAPTTAEKDKLEEIMPKVRVIERDPSTRPS